VVTPNVFSKEIIIISYELGLCTKVVDLNETC
jgi:hypothetical protein